MYLLDTNTISDVLRNENGAASQIMKAIDPALLVTSVIVSGELKFGAEWKRAPTLRRRIDEMLRMISVLSIDDETGEIYARIRADLVRKGQIIGPNDLWIAAHALALDAVLVTDNEREFSRIPGLKIQNWLRDAAEVKG